MQIGKYEIVNELGRGGMGVVYRARDPVLSREVAIKTILRGSFPNESELQSRFLIEARATAQLQHPGIVQIYDFGDDESQWYIVMEFVEGRSLRDVLHGDPPPLDAARKEEILALTAAALDYAHDRGVVHRDIKPANILLTRDNQPKITDFGIAKLPLLRSDGFKTQIGTVVGTIGYMAPEQAQGEEVDGRADQFSLAVIAYEIATGRLPFDAQTEFGRLKKVMDGSATPARQINPRLGERAERSLSRALSRTPHDRFPSCMEFVVELQAGLRESAGWEIASPAPPPPMPPRPPGPAIVGPPAPRTSLPENPATMVGQAVAPTGFFRTSVFQKTAVFQNEAVQLDALEKTFRFYRDQLTNEYRVLSRQAGVTFYLWIVCVGLGFAMLFLGIGMMYFSKITEGLVTAAASTLIYFIQRVFHEREDHYRSMAGAKLTHLEYGNEWLLAIQTIDAITDSAEKTRQLGRLGEVLMGQLRSHSDKGQVVQMKSARRARAGA